MKPARWSISFIAVASLTSSLLAGSPGIHLPLLDLRGEVHALEQNDGRRVRVFVFLGSECPISRSYIPELNRLAQRIAGARRDRNFSAW